MKRIFIVDKRTGEIKLEKRYEELFEIPEKELKTRAKRLMMYISKKKYIEIGYLTYKID